MRAQDYDLAWALSERALQERDPADRDDPALPYHLRWVWDGRDYSGRHCLVRCYHGLGDTIQFSRYLPMLARCVASLRVEAPSRLIPLLRRIVVAAGCPGIDFIAFDMAHPSPPSECDLEITELAFALRASPTDTAVPYLPAPRAIMPHMTVGLCHRAGGWDRGRSIEVDLLGPLCAEARILSLVTEPADFDAINPCGCPLDMEVTAALVASTDLVITVDTMIAHLAGAMGRPTWLLLTADPDWRWPIEGHGTPWYPTIHIYRQQCAGDWNALLADVTRDLSAFTAATVEGEAS